MGDKQCALCWLIPFEQIISEINPFIDTMGTKFVLETLEMLRRNGRLSNMTAMLVNALNIKLVMTSDGKLRAVIGAA